MTIDLVCGAIGIKANQREAIGLASRHGFESVQPDGKELAGLSKGQLDEVVGELKSKSLVWGAAGLPVEFRADAAKFKQDLSGLPPVAKALQAAGAMRVATWLMPCHNELTYVANFRQHAARLREVAGVLGDHGLRFGLEYVGTRTLWSSRLHPFVHTMAEMSDLIAEIAAANVGFLLDSWHWYTAGESADDIRALKNEQVVAVDLNDAPAGVERDAQIDGRRELPATTGVIDVKAFLGALQAIGYDGPVRAEPFNATLNAMDNEQAAAATVASLKRAMRQA